MHVCVILGISDLTGVHSPWLGEEVRGALWLRVRPFSAQRDLDHSLKWKLGTVKPDWLPGSCTWLYSDNCMERRRSFSAQVSQV